MPTSTAPSLSEISRPSGFGSNKPSHPRVLDFVERVAVRCRPDRIFWCDGSQEEYAHLSELAVRSGILTPLDQEKWPGCFHHRSRENDVARVEHLTYICTSEERDAGPTNNWCDPKEMRSRLEALLEGSMEGRTLYVVPYLMGVPGSDQTKAGIELTDSLYVVLNMRIMTRMGAALYDHPRYVEDFNRGVHSLLDVDPEKRCIAHFPEDNEIISVGSGYGGNVLLGKKCLALRIGSALGRREGWMAEHMLLLKVESPEGRVAHVAAAFPSACGKTNFAMMVPPKEFAGWKIRTIGDDIAWMRPDRDGRLRAVNPEAGYFGVIPGTNAASNPNAMATISRDSIFTNVGLSADGDIWWEGKDTPPPANLSDWRGRPWSPESGEKCAHPNSRFTAPMRNNPALAEEAEQPEGVPIDAIIFGGRRSDTMPLVFQAFDWAHGVYLGATMGSEMTAAAAGELGQVRRDPMAMLPFCGYNIGDYFGHWLAMKEGLRHLPLIFHVNWFRKDADGAFLWPGFGENMRVLRWIVDRCQGDGEARRTPLGWMPDLSRLDLRGLENKVTPEVFEQLQRIDREEWLRELASQEEFFGRLQPDVPEEILRQLQALKGRL